MSSQVDLFKEIMGHYPTGVTIVTTTTEKGEPVGLTVNSFASVSLDPLMVLWCIDHKTSSYDAFIKNPRFAVHVLADDQEDLCWLFAGKGTDRFANIQWTLADNVPLIEDCYAILNCEKVQEVEAGDHTILIGKVTGLSKKDKRPMLYFNRKLGAIPDHW